MRRGRTSEDREEPAVEIGVQYRRLNRSRMLKELSMSTMNKQTLEKANAAITQGDFEGFLALCTEDTVWTFEGDRTLRGKAEVREWLHATYKTLPQFSVQHMIAEDDFVVAIGEITLKDRDGHTVENAYCDVWRFRDGKLAQLRAFVVET